MEIRDRPVEVITMISSTTAEKIDASANRNTPIVLNFNVSMDEVERKSDSVEVKFGMIMDSDPPVAKFTVEGTARATGEMLEIERILEPDPQTNVPSLFTKVYQQVYPVIFMLAGTMDTPYPSPVLLKTVQVKVARPEELRR